MANTNIYDMADTWNNAGTTFTAIKMNVTDTASAAGSLLMDLQVGGESKFSIGKNGVLYFGSYGTTTSRLIGGTTSLQVVAQDKRFNFINASGGQLQLGSGYGLTWNSGLDPTTSSPDLVLLRDAANILAQRNGTNAQAFRLYNTYTDAANYERGGLEWTGSVMNIGSFAAAGTGLVRDVQFMRNGAVYAQLMSAGWNFLTHVIFNIDNTYDIGQNGAFRPRDIHVARDLKVAGRTHVSVVATASLPAAGAAEDGRVLIEDAAAGDRNFIIYAGGQRFRIDGGVAF